MKFFKPLASLFLLMASGCASNSTDGFHENKSRNFGPLGGTGDRTMSEPLAMGVLLKDALKHQSPAVRKKAAEIACKKDQGPALKDATYQVVAPDRWNIAANKAPVLPCAAQTMTPMGSN